MIHHKTYNIKSWDFRGKEGWSIGVSLDHYWFQRIILHKTKAEQISDTSKFRHQTITTSVVTLEDRILHGITRLKNALTDAPTAQSDSQIQAITALRDASASW